MTEQIEELAEQTSLLLFDDTAHHRMLPGFAEKFAELIVEECIRIGQAAELDGSYDWGNAIRDHFGIK